MQVAEVEYGKRTALVSGDSKAFFQLSSLFRREGRSRGEVSRLFDYPFRPPGSVVVTFFFRGRTLPGQSLTHTPPRLCALFHRESEYVQSRNQQGLRDVERKSFWEYGDGCLSLQGWKSTLGIYDILTLGLVRDHRTLFINCPLQSCPVCLQTKSIISHTDSQSPHHP